MAKSNRKTIHSWAMYDWANSVYSLLITSTLFPVYYGEVVKNLQGGDLIHFFGFRILNSSLYSFAISAAFLFSAILSPFLSSLSDLQGKRKGYLLFFCTLGAISCSSLSAFPVLPLELSMLAFSLAAVAFSASLVFYNSFLPEISRKEDYDRVSARGFAYGYVGSVLLLVLVLLPLFLPEKILANKPSIATLCLSGFLLTGLWWWSFGNYAIRGLPDAKPKAPSTNLSLRKVWNRLHEGWDVALRTPGLLTYLMGFFFFNMGVQTVMYMAAIFGKIELNVGAEKLILTVLILQLVAILGAWFFVRISRIAGQIWALLVAGILWIGVCTWAFFIQSDVEFFGVAAVVGLLMGGSQSLFRSTFSSYLPSSEHGQSLLFSFSDILEKLSIMAGTLAFGWINEASGSMRWSALALSLMFLVGIFWLFLAKTNTLKRGRY